MRQSGIFVLILVFLLGAGVGLAATATLPEMALVSLYQQWGLWGLIGRAAIAILLVGMPVTYIAWLVTSSIQAMRPQQPPGPSAGSIMPETPGRLERILVPVGGGTNVLLGLALVDMLADGGPAKVTLMRVVPPSMTEAGIAAQEQVLLRMAREHLSAGHEVTARVVAGPSVVRAIAAEARVGGYDLVVVGASDRPAVRTMLFGTLPQALAEQVPCPLVVVRAPTAAT